MTGPLRSVQTTGRQQALHAVDTEKITSRCIQTRALLHLTSKDRDVPATSPRRSPAMNTLSAIRPAAKPASQTEILARIFADAPAPEAANDPVTQRPSLLVRRRQRQRRREVW